MEGSALQFILTEGKKGSDCLGGGAGSLWCLWNPRSSTEGRSHSEKAVPSSRFLLSLAHSASAVLMAWFSPDHLGTLAPPFLAGSFPSGLWLL